MHACVHAYNSSNKQQYISTLLGGYRVAKREAIGTATILVLVLLEGWWEVMRCCFAIRCIAYLYTLPDIGGGGGGLYGLSFWLGILDRSSTAAKYTVVVVLPAVLL